MSQKTMTASPVDAEQRVQRWIKDMVVGLNLCPFARREMVNDRIRYVVEPASQPIEILQTVLRECNQLADDDRYETTIVILQRALTDFDEYNQFLSLVDSLLVEAGYEGIFQIASFHPDYQFAGVSADDVTNYTNRSPLPLLHILREASVSRALDSYPDAAAIPERNIALLKSLGIDAMKDRLER